MVVNSKIAKTFDVANTVMCLGLNKLIPKIKSSRWAKWALAIVILNEIRGLTVVYEVLKAGLF